MRIGKIKVTSEALIKQPLGTKFYLSDTKYLLMNEYILMIKRTDSGNMVSKHCIDIKCTQIVFWKSEVEYIFHSISFWPAEETHNSDESNRPCYFRKSIQEVSVDET